MAGGALGALAVIGFGKLSNKGADEIRQEVSKRLDY